MTRLSDTAALPNSVHNTSDFVINLPSATPSTNLESNRNTRRCIRSAITDQLFTGPELAKLLLTLDYGGILATPVISYNHILPEYYLSAISVFLLIGFFALLSAIALHKTFPNPAETLGLIGTACVVAVIPTITAGVLPKLGVLVWIFFLLLLLIAVLCILLAHMAIHGEGNSDAGSEIEAVSKNIEPSIAQNEVKSALPPATEVKLEMPPATEVKLGPRDDAGKVEFWNSDVFSHVHGVNPPLKEMRGFFRRVWGRYGIDKVFKLRDGGFVVRFHEYAKALKVVEGRGVMFDGKLVITKLCPGLECERKPLICENCKSSGHRVADHCRKRPESAKKMWVPKTSDSVVAAANINGSQEEIGGVHNVSVIKTADKGKSICIGN